MIADNMHSADQVRVDVLHEILGHFGLRGVLGERLNPVLVQVAEHFDLTKIMHLQLQILLFFTQAANLRRPTHLRS
jgi:hypothetical protein